MNEESPMDFAGTVCAGSLGRVGLVVRQKEIDFGDRKQVMWEGIGLDGKGLWCTANPIVIQPSIEAYMDRLERALDQPGAMYPPLGVGGQVPFNPQKHGVENAHS